MRRRKFMSAALGLGTLATAGAYGLPPAQQRLHSRAGNAFGTTVSIQLYHADAQQAELAIDDAFAALRTIDALMSVYRESSQVHRLNAQGRLALPDPHLLTVLAEARRVSQMTHGAFDITVQALWQAFAEAGDTSPLAGAPSPDTLQQARRLVGWQHVAFNAGEVRLLRPGMALTLNGIAQGYAADLTLAAVRARGVEHALIDAGEFAVHGRKSANRPWIIGIQDPRHRHAQADAIALDGRSVATSGDYATSFSGDFSAHHIFDPQTGRSPTELASVTVLAPTAMLADALSTAFMVMGRQRAMALAAGLEGVDVLVIDKRGHREKSAGFPGSLVFA
ncbi:MAG: FAD:protein FMN transferase [Noviherbaspirillum sp.]